MDYTPESRFARRLYPVGPAATAITVAIATTVAAAAVAATLPRHLSRRTGFWIKCYIREEPPGYY